MKCCWENEGMKCLRDLLIKYQIDDVRHLVVGIENMLQHYKEQGVCIFKECFSLPGVLKILMHRCASKSGSYLPLFNKSMSYLKIYKQCRYEKSCQMFVRNNPNKVCKSIIGLDANSLYG